MALFYLRMSNIIPDHIKLRELSYPLSRLYLAHNNCRGHISVYF